MGKHVGFIVRDMWAEQGDKSGKRWLFRARDPDRRTYSSKRFSEKRDGMLWVQMKTARLRVGLDMSGELETSLIVTEYVAELRRRGRVERHVADVERVLRGAIAAGLTDLRSPRLLQQARAWLSGLQSTHRFYAPRPLSASSRNRYLVILRALVRFAVKMNYLPRDPLGTLERSKVDRPLKPTFSITELRKLLAREHEADPYFLRFALLAYTGCRVGEAMHLRWEHIDWEAHRIAIVLDGAYSLKGRKERAVPLQRELADILNPIAKPAGWIIEDHNDRERAQTYGWHFKAFLKRCGITPGERSPHSTRHTWIALMLASGENAPLVQAYAGHESLITTAGYAGTQDRYRDAVEGWKRGSLALRAMDAAQTQEA